VEEVVEFVAAVVVAASFAGADWLADSILVLKSRIAIAASVGVSRIATSEVDVVGNEGCTSGAAKLGSGVE
jgi:archaellum component FlaG (FlaF/FlaG flagellin family)